MQTVGSRLVMTPKLRGRHAGSW